MRLMLNDKINSSFGSKFKILGAGEHTGYRYIAIYIKEDGTAISSVKFLDGTTLDTSDLAWNEGEVIFCGIKELTITTGTVLAYMQ